jgi:hypothetical protein
MFTNISWTSYILVVTLFLAVWYLIIGLRFYFNDVQNLFTRKRKLSFQLASDETNSTAGSEFTIEQTETLVSDDVFYEVEKLTSKLKETIADASSKNYQKEEFIFLLQLTLKEYPHLKGSPFQVAINNLIASECEKHGSLHLSAQEQVMLWKEVA